MSIDLRAIVRARMLALGVDQATLARVLAPRWECSPDSAVRKLSRWFNRERGARGDMGTDALADVLTELRLTVAGTPSPPTQGPR